MFCPRPALLNPGATPAVLSQPRRKHPSAERFVQRPVPPSAENRSAKLTMVNDALNALAQEPTLVLSL